MVPPCTVDVQVPAAQPFLVEAELLHHAPAGVILRADTRLDPVQADDEETMVDRHGQRGGDNPAAGHLLVDPVTHLPGPGRAPQDAADGQLAGEPPAVGDGPRQGLALPWAVIYDGKFVGQLTVGSILWGSARSGQVGYWVDERVAGRGVIPTALAMAIDHCFFVEGLHRVEASIRPENHASRRVVEKLGFHEEGLRRRYLHIDGAWRDHLCYAITIEDVPGGLMPRWRGILSASRSGTAS